MQTATATAARRKNVDLAARAERRAALVALAVAEYESVMAIRLPWYRGMIRSEPRYRRAERIRRLLRRVGLDGSRVRSHSTAGGWISVMIPLRPHAITFICKRIGHRVKGLEFPGCPVCDAFDAARLHVLEIIYAAYPDLENHDADGCGEAIVVLSA